MKKFSSIFLSVTTTITLTGVMGLVPVAHGQSVADLQAQIAALQAALNALQGGSVMVSASFTRDLTVGSRGDDVKSLQMWLNSKGHTVSMSGGGSPGNETMYFGPATRAAVAKFQAANGISPAVGYFGPKTRAAVNAMGGGTMSPVGGGPVVPGSGLSVSLAAGQPTASVIAGASRLPVLKFNLTASNAAPVTVNRLQFNKVGVVSDSNVSSAYLVENNQVIAQYTSINNGVIDFSGLNLVVNAGQTRMLEFAMDLSSSATAGNTLSFQLASMSNVSTNGSVPVSGVFPVSGNTLTVTTVSNPSLATLTIASASVGTSVYAGTQNVLVSQWTLTGANNPVMLKSINFKVIGSANKTDLRNVKLFLNGSQVGPTLPSVTSDGVAFFDLGANPAKINTGSGNMQVYADVMGSPSYTFQFELLNSFDVLATDQQYGAGVSVTINGGSGVSITINQGQITLTAATDTPSGNIALGGSGTTLAKFTIYAAGEAVKVKYLDFRLAWTGTTETLSDMVKNVALIDDTGLQVGTTINTPPSTRSCNGNGTAFTAGYNAAGSQYNDCFGTSASPINYIVPANTARTLSLIADVQTSASFTTVTGSLTQMAGGNLQGLTSAQTSNSGSVSGASLTLATTPLTAASNGGLGTPRYAAGASGVRIGSYTLTASSAEAVNVSNMTITFSALATNYQNVMLKVGSTQFGTTKSTLSASDVITFSGTPIVVPKGGSVVVDVYGDILSSAAAATNAAVTTLTSCTATGSSTNASISCSPTAVAGQSVTIAGSPTVTVTVDQSTQLAGQMVMGSTGNSLATFKFIDTANIEPVKITALTITDDVSTSSGTTTNTKASFTNLTMWQGNTQVGGPVNMADGTGIAAATYKSDFNFAPPLVVPQNGTLVLQMKGDLASYNSNGASDNRIHIFKVNAAAQVTAIGQSSNTSATATVSSATGNQLTVLRSKLTVTGAALGATTGRTRNSVDDVATLTFTADPAGDVNLNSITLKFQGLAVSNGTAINTVRLLSGGTDWNGLSSAGSSCTTGAGNSCTLSFNFSASTASTTISAGTSKTVTLRLDSSNFFNGANTQDSLSILVNAAGDVNWGDVNVVNIPNTTTTGLALETKVVPLTIGTVSYE